ncbi:MAG: peptidoglycan DD-metalloendopeptidase family protein [Candidatus Muiribacteriota bacterium]
MEDTNIIKSMDRVINLVLVAIIIQFAIISTGSLRKEKFKVYTSSISTGFLSTSVTDNNVNIIDENNSRIVRDKINQYSKNVLSGENVEDVIVIRVNVPEQTIVDKVKKQVETNVLTDGEVSKDGDKNSVNKKNVPNVWHNVKRGENLTAIAKLYDISISDLKALNELRNDMIFEGQKLKISKLDGVDYEVQRGDSLWVIAKKYDTTIKSLMEVNEIDNYEIRAGEKIKVFPGEKWFLARKRENSKMFIWPLDNQITSPYGNRVHPVYGRQLFHAGVDIRGAIGEQIKAAGDGKVIHASENGGYGLLVTIQHERGYETRYAHCSKILVKVGDTVKRGQVIARVGNTGVSTGPHLHFEVRRFGKTEDPTKFR